MEGSSMTDQEQIDALKAQVNCLRNCLQQARNDKDREAFERCYGRTLASTSEQCLAEVKAKAIEDALFYADHIGSNGNGYDYAEEDLQAYADQLRGSKRNEQNP